MYFPAGTARNVPVPPRTRAARGRGAVLCRCDDPCHPHWLLGPAASAHPRPSPAAPGAHAFSARLPLARTAARKSVCHCPLAQGLLRTTTPARRRSALRRRARLPRAGGLSYRKQGKLTNRACIRDATMRGDRMRGDRIRSLNLSADEIYMGGIMAERGERRGQGRGRWYC